MLLLFLLPSSSITLSFFFHLHSSPISNNLFKIIQKIKIFEKLCFFLRNFDLLDEKDLFLFSVFN